MAIRKTAVIGGTRKLVTDCMYSKSSPLLDVWMTGIHRILTHTRTRMKTLQQRHDPKGLLVYCVWSI